MYLVRVRKHICKVQWWGRMCSEWRLWLWINEWILLNASANEWWESGTGPEKSMRLETHIQKSYPVQVVFEEALCSPLLTSFPKERQKDQRYDSIGPCLSPAVQWWSTFRALPLSPRDMLHICLVETFLPGIRAHKLHCSHVCLINAHNPCILGPCRSTPVNINYISIIYI